MLTIVCLIIEAQIHMNLWFVLCCSSGGGGRSQMAHANFTQPVIKQVRYMRTRVQTFM